MIMWKNAYAIKITKQKIEYKRIICILEERCVWKCVCGGVSVSIT